MLRRPQLDKFVRRSQGESNLEDEHHAGEKNKEEKMELTKYIVQYMKCAEVLFSDNKNEKVLKLLNQQDMDGNTPLHYAARNWPRNIVIDLLKLGADIRIKNKQDKIPLRDIPKDHIKALLDEHCLKSLQDDVYEGPHLDPKDVGEKDRESFKQLMKEYDPRFMTNINQSPIQMDFGLLVPSQNAGDDAVNRNGGNEENNDHEKISQPEMSVLHELSQSKAHKDLVIHPVIKMFVWMKWNKVSRYYHRLLRTEFLLMYVMTWYIFDQFGGVGFQNTLFEPGKVSNITNDSDFCEFHGDKFRIINKHHIYGHLEQMNISQRLEYYFAAFHGELECNETSGSKHFELCKHKSADIHIHLPRHNYLHVSYVMFLPVALALIYWTIMDAKLIFDSKNDTDSGKSTSGTFRSKVVPLAGDVALLILIISVIAFADGVLWFVISYIFISILTREAMQMCVSPRKYFATLSNWADMLLLTLICLVVYVPNKYIKDPMYFTLTPKNLNLLCNSTKVDEKQPDSWNDVVFPGTKIEIEFDVSVKRSLSGFLIVLLWTRFVFDVARHPGKRTEKFNKYSLMYQRVASSFLKLLLTYALFIISFSLGFYVMFHDDVGDKSLKINPEAGPLSSYVFFNTPFQSFIKSMAMFVGEVDFNNIPIGVPYGRRDGDMSLTLSYVFYLLFMFMVVMVLMNLLNGLAVTDITEIIKESEVLHQISMINILNDWEELSLRNKNGLERISKICRMNVGLMRFLDVSKELLIFESGGKKTRTFEQKSSLLNFNPQDPNTNLPRCLSWLGNKQAFGYIGNEYILSKARKLVLRNNESSVAHNAMTEPADN